MCLNVLSFILTNIIVFILKNIKMAKGTKSPSGKISFGKKIKGRHKKKRNKHDRKESKYRGQGR